MKRKLVTFSLGVYLMMLHRVLEQMIDLKLKKISFEFRNEIWTITKEE